MKAFDHPNLENFLCPVCKTNKDSPVVLIGVYGTENDGIIEANQYHLDCIDLTEVSYPENRKFLIQELP